MRKLVRCKTCGYVMEEGRMKDCCPACGVPAKLFEPYTDKVSEKRRFILGLDIHPVAVHLPQAFGAAVLLFAAATLVASGGLKQTIECSVQTLSVCLPFTGLAAVATGLFDGTVRFKKLATPHLRIKMALGAGFLVLSTALAVLSFTAAPAAIVYPTIALAAGCLALGTCLGLIGARLVHAVFPG
jgi:hypothetical protein